MRFLFAILVFCIGQGAYSQQDSIPKPKEQDSIPVTIEQDSVGVVKRKDSAARDSILLARPKKGPPKEQDSISIRDYKIISYARDTVFLDTTLTISKEYKYNYLRKDDFELMPFTNIGRPYNSLGKTFSNRPFYPQMGSAAKHFNYFEIEDIKYYSVPTPMTELMFKTTLEQGQLLDALLTFNLSPRFNTSIAFKGFRSLGKYQYEETQSGNFRATFNYVNKKETYGLRGHITAQDITAEENGGLADKDQFESDSPDFTERFRLDVQFIDAFNRLLGKRYFLEQQLKLFGRKKDSTNKEATALSIGHEFWYETKLSDFEQTSQSDLFGSDPFVTPIEDRARLKNMFNKVSAKFSNKILGEITGGISLYNYNYFFNSILIQEDGTTIQNQLKGEEIAINGRYKKKIGRLELLGDLNYNLSGSLTSNSFNAQAKYQVNDGNIVSGAINISSRMPDFNFLLYQSDYRNYNWQNTATFENQQTQSIQFKFDSKKWGLLEAEYSAVDNYTYFASLATEEEIEADQEMAFIKPFQETSTINHLRVKYSKEFKWRKWAFNSAVLYQNVTQENQVINVPELVTRNTVYFSKEVFKKAMFLQTGVTFKYFTSYNMDAYNPLLGEFYIQNNEELGGFPLLDFFINAKVRQTRIYLKAEHFNSLFMEPNYYAAPNYPYRDFVIRFGLVWNFFS